VRPFHSSHVCRGKETYGRGGCIAGAAPVAELERMIAGAGFADVRVAVQAQSRALMEEWSPGAEQFREAVRSCPR
jgi:hypothetical protein